MLRTKHVYAVVAMGLGIVLAPGCSKPTPDVPIVSAVQVLPIVDVEEIRSDTFQHARNLLIRMNQSQWNEANVNIVEGVVPASAGASLLIFEIPAPIGGEPVWFMRPNCPPCYDVVFTHYGWQCQPTSACIGVSALPPCAEVRLIGNRMVCFGSCSEGGSCEYRAFRLAPEFTRFMMQAHADELTAIWIDLKDSGFKRRELFSNVRLIGYYCACN